MCFLKCSMIILQLSLCLATHFVYAAQTSELPPKCVIRGGNYEVQIVTSAGLIELQHKIYITLRNNLDPKYCSRLSNTSDDITNKPMNFMDHSNRTLVRTNDGEYDLECLIIHEFYSIVNFKDCQDILKFNSKLNYYIKHFVERRNQNHHSIIRRTATEIKNDQLELRRSSINEYNLENQINSQIYDSRAAEYVQEFLKRNPADVPSKFYPGEKGSNRVVITVTSGAYVLVHNITFHKSCVREGNVITVICVSFSEISSYTYNSPKTVDSKLLAVVNTNTNTKSNGFHGVVNIRTACWKRYSAIELCNASFQPLPQIMSASILSYSPLSHNFWLGQKDKHMLQKDWIIKFNIEIFDGNVPSEWVPELMLSSLNELRIKGNDWGRPKKLLSPLPNLKWLVLNDNNIEILPTDMFNNTPSLQFIFLDGNNISECPEGIQYLDNIVELSISESTGMTNLSFTDANLDALDKVNILWLGGTNLQVNVSNILKLPDIRCLNLSGCHLQEIRDDISGGADNLTLTECDLSFNMLSTLPTNIFSRFKLLSRLLLHDNLFTECPEQSFRNLQSLEYLNLNRNNISNIRSTCFPKLNTLKYLYLSYNKIHALEYGIFDAHTSLLEINLSHNMISVIDDRVFVPLTSLGILDLSVNRIHKEPIIGNTHLNNLILSNNSISKIQNMTKFVKSIDNVQLSANNISELTLSNVHMLNLSYNSLQIVPQNMWTSLDRVKALDLGGNSFKCCHNLTSMLQNRLNDSKTTILNLNKEHTLSCSLKEAHQEVLLKTFVYSEDLCDNTVHNLWVQVGVPLGLMVTISFVMMAVLYLYRFELTYISYLFKMKKRGKETDEKRYDKCAYDAFVCYSGKDFTWVIDDLLPQLENGAENYRLCLHDRDFTIGAAIDRNIVASIEKSRKVIIVLTKDFIGSKWCQWELEMANHKTFEEDKSYVIMIELERLQRNAMPRHLRYLMDTRTYLEWPSPGADERRLRRAWQRLREALGDSLFQRKGTKPQQCTVLYS